MPDAVFPPWLDRRKHLGIAARLGSLCGRQMYKRENFALDAEINRTGPAPLADLEPPPALAPRELEARARAGALVLDTRPAAQFGAGHIPGAVHIGLVGQYASWAGRLARVGMERVAGYLEGGMAAWFGAGLPVAPLAQITVQDLQRAMDHVQLVDVRQPGEWEQGHIAGARLKPLPKLVQSLDGLDRERPVAVHCKSGYRSSIAASLLRREGFGEVVNVIGGFDAWKACGLRVV